MTTEKQRAAIAQLLAGLFWANGSPVIGEPAWRLVNQIDGILNDPSLQDGSADLKSDFKKAKPPRPKLTVEHLRVLNERARNYATWHHEHVSPVHNLEAFITTKQQAYEADPDLSIREAGELADWHQNHRATNARYRQSQERYGLWETDWPADRDLTGITDVLDQIINQRP